MEALAILYLVLAGAVAAAPVAVARRRGHTSGRVRVVFVLAAVGLVAVGYGLFALMVNGYVEDSGSEPARTLGRAVALFTVGTVLTAAAWLVASPRANRR